MEEQFVIEQIAPIVTRRLRQKVLYPNQHLDSVMLKEDNSGVHFGLYTSNALIAVVSLFLYDEQARFRKFAVENNYQNQGYGSKLLQYITDYTANESISTLWCHARNTAVPFYKKNGFTKVGQPFKKGNIIYVKMEKPLTNIH
ncbi:hypothetical protein GCM10023231_27920 [Olivibacter ginsenosidimutans]|uniref:N-acetyltransferase domain-containing protein n=1 Tax=Olivibacter ginsenosidimutans TaxID=1176537 RepID=A0ABP9BN31_9SPHI